MARRDLPATVHIWLQTTMRAGNVWANSRRAVSFWCKIPSCELDGNSGSAWS